MPDARRRAPEPRPEAFRVDRHRCNILDKSQHREPPRTTAPNRRWTTKKGKRTWVHLGPFGPTAADSLPLVVYSSTQLSLISDTSTFPSESGVSPLGDPAAFGGWWVQLPAYRLVQDGLAVRVHDSYPAVHRAGG